MKKRLLLILLAIAMLFSALPAAGAATLPGYTSKVDYTNIDPDRYMIEVDLNNQIITVYERDAAGKYSNMILQSLCTTGNEEFPTGAGNFRMGDLKERFGYFVAFGQYAQYWSQVVRGVYIHSVMFNNTKLSSLSKSAYNGLGKALSHGCIRVLPEVARWIFYNCPPGTLCRITRSKAADPALAKSLKSGIVSYANYVHQPDDKPAPPVVPAVVRLKNTLLRTGFSATRDTTVATLQPGDKVDLLQVGGEWVKARTMKGKLGYVRTSSLVFDPDAAFNSETHYSASSKTYLYASASTGAKKLVTVPKGAEVKVNGSASSGWYAGSYDGTQGYFSAKAISKKTVLVYPTLEDAVNNGGAVPGTARQAVVKSTLRASFRDQPTTAGSVIIAVLDPGTPVTILGTTGNWYYAESNGMKGYINAICLDIIG